MRMMFGCRSDESREISRASIDDALSEAAVAVAVDERKRLPTSFTATAAPVVAHVAA